MTNSEFGRMLMIRGRVLVSVFMLAAAATAVSAQAIQSAETPRGEAFAPTPPYIERIARDRPIARMSVRDVVEQTVRANLDLVLERYNQLLARQRLVATEGFYDPSVTLASSLGQATNPLTASPGDIRVPGETIQTSGFGPTIRQNVLGGGVVSAGVTNSYSQTSSLVPTVNPSFSSVFSASVTQPLLRGFVRTATDRQAKNGRLDITISDLLYRQKVTQVLQQVLNQYWELVFANESYEARRQSRNLAVTQYESTRLRIAAALLAPVALTAARAEIASRDRDMLQAEVQIINAENNLKLLLSDDPASSIWAMAIVPTDRPDPGEVPFSLEDALALARAQRPELEQIRLQVAQNEVDRKFYDWDRKPTANLTAGLVSSGKSGTVYQRLTDGRVADPTNPSFGGYQSSWRQVFGFDFLAWSASFNVQVPIRNRSADSQMEQVRIAQTRLQTQMMKTMQAVTVEVRNLFQVIETLKKSLDAARLTTQLFEEQLTGQTARYEVGLSTDFELLRYQRDLVDARVRELRAVVDLQQAMIALQKSTDSLLDANAVDVKRP
jgi:outer membrane protein